MTADLEHSRHTRWLLGLVLALAIVVAALEFTSSNTEGSLDDLLSEEIPEDMEFVPNVENDEQLEALQPQAPVLAEELVEVTDAQTDVNNQEVVSPPPLDIAVEIDPSIDDLVLADTPVEVEQNDSEEPLPMRVVEQLPQFPGGTPLFIKWLTKNLKYPESAKRQNIQGRVMVSFVVNADGTTTDEKAWRKLNLSWAVTPVLSENYSSMDVMFWQDLKYAKDLLNLKQGDNVVLTGGQINGAPGNTNTIKVEMIK